MGKYLIVEHEPRKVDLIVCVAGGDVERALAVVDVFRQGLGPYILRAKEEKPDGFNYLKKQIKNYPTGFDLFESIMEGFKIPEKVILSPDERVSSTRSMFSRSMRWIRSFGSMAPSGALSR